MSLYEVSRLITEGYEVYKRAIQESEENRTTCINDLAVSKAKAGEVKVTNALKQMILTKEQKNLGLRYTGWMARSEHAEEIKKVYSSSETGEFIEYSSQKDIENEWLENERRFT